MTARGLLVSEVFGPTIQGEGRSMGRRCAFVRLGGCNLHCNWCDTPYTWAFDKRHANLHISKKQYDPKKELRRVSPTEVAQDIVNRIPQGGLVVVSGGEPMLQQSDIISLIGEIDTCTYERGRRTSGYTFEIETAGTIPPTRGMILSGVHFNVSPKLSHSGNEWNVAYRPEVLRAFAALDETMFKFVCQSLADLDEVQEQYVDMLGLRPSSVYIMPEGTTAETVLARGHDLVDKVIERGWNFTTRLHTLLWGAERGR
jgi:7-carboxy-7-deazaguanine synthase